MSLGRWLLALALVFITVTVGVAIAEDEDDETTPTPEPTPAATAQELTATPVPLPDEVGRRRIVPDPELRHQIHEGLTATRRPALQNIRIRVEEGVVHLDGTVRTYQERALAEAVARTLPGVRSVNSRLRLSGGFRRQTQPSDSRSMNQIAFDEQVRKRVLREVAAVPGVRVSQVQVEVFEGVVVISGMVPTEAHREKLRERVERARGVSNVVDHLRVEEETDSREE